MFSSRMFFFRIPPTRAATCSGLLRLPALSSLAGLLLALGTGCIDDGPRDALDAQDAPLAQEAPAADGAALPAVSDPSRPGTFKVEFVNNAPGLSSHSLFVPSSPSGARIAHPVVVWTNGNGGSISFYRAFLDHIASHGFFIVADKRSTSNHPLENGEQVKGIDWVVAQAASGAYAGRLDTKKIAIMGHSLGSLASFENGKDPRVATSVHWSGGLTGNPVGADESALAKLHAPAAFFCGGTDTMAGPSCAKDFDKAPASLPVFYGTLAGVGHLGVFGNRNGGEYGRVGVAWLRLQLLGDESFRSYFSGADCKACQRPWTGKSRNLDGP
ncbi:MAG: hypothetical protein ABW252_22105 [Polyangiales bacterium]